MKSVAFLSVLALSTSAVFAAATTQTANTIGVLRVDSTANRTIVAVPWVGASVSNESVRVTDIVKTANLSVDDTLSYYNSATGEFQTWTLVAGGGGNPPVWQAATEVVESGSGEKGVSSDVQTLPRGGALILVRQNATNPPYFYLQGQVPTGGSVAVTLPTNSLSGPVYSLIAPPLAQTNDISLASGVWKDVGAMDQIVIQGVGGLNTTCQWKDDAWKYGLWTEDANHFKTLTWTNAPAIKSGTGFWYVSRTPTNVQASVSWETGKTEN